VAKLEHDRDAVISRDHTGGS